VSVSFLNKQKENAMGKVKITNNQMGACVINSLKIIIAGKGFVVRDDSVVGDADLTELENEGLITVTPFETVVVATPLVVTTNQPQMPPVVVTESKKAGRPKKQAQQQPQPQKPVQPPPQAPKQKKQKPGTSFNVDDYGPENAMGNPVVVMGKDGPEVKKMSPGINAQANLNDPKDITPPEEGDDAPEGTGLQADGFTTISPPESPRL
jgi:hypothetical protein